MELQPLLAGLRHHLDSVKANTDQVGELGAQVAKTKALIDDALYRLSGSP